MPGLTFPALVQRFRSDLEAAGASVALLGASEGRPQRIRVTSRSGTAVEAFLYLWTITSGGRGRSETERRIQITGTTKFKRAEGLRTIVGGWSEEHGVYGFWDARRHRDFSAQSPSFQVEEVILVRAAREGAAAGARPVQSGVEVVVSIRPGALLWYVEGGEIAHTGTAEAIEALNKARDLQKVDVAVRSDSGPALVLVSSVDQIRSNLYRFNRDAPNFRARAEALISQATFWVYESDRALFAPAKFVGFRSMTFGSYEAALAGRSAGAAFDGHLTRQAIEEVLEEEFQRHPELADRLVLWGEPWPDRNPLAGADTEKWRFLRLDSRRSYWAFVSDPTVHDVEAALGALAQDTWTTERRNVRRGDRVAIWRAEEEGRGSIVGLGEVLSDPEVRKGAADGRRFYLRPPATKPEPRVWLRLIHPARCPVGIEEDDSGVLASLSVARSRGDTVFQIEPEHWQCILSLVGGWIAPASEDEALEEVVRRSRQPGSGQGPKLTPAVKKAVELHAMRQAEEHFLTLGFDVQDVSGEQSFDLLCTSGQDELHVEVKGTQTQGRQVLLTSNEVSHHRETARTSALYVLHSIEVHGEPDSPEAAGGEAMILLPWVIEDHLLSPVGFRYAVPHEPRNQGSGTADDQVPAALSVDVEFTSPSGRLILIGDLGPDFPERLGSRAGPDEPLRVEATRSRSQAGNYYYSWDMHRVPFPDGFSTRVRVEGTLIKPGLVRESRRGNPMRSDTGQILLGSTPYVVKVTLVKSREPYWVKVIAHRKPQPGRKSPQREPPQ